MKILILSNTPWNDNNSFGNSFSNIFGGDFNYEIANIYCQPGTPQTQVCKRFFQITEKNILHFIFGKKQSSGQEIFQSNNKVKGQILSLKEKTVSNKLKLLRWQIFFWLRDLIWATGKWKTVELDDFIDDFHPDIVFLPIYYSTYLNTIGLYLKKRANVPMVGYISDDCYTLKQFSFSPLFWIDRFIKRIYVKRGIDSCQILYTITKTQRDEYNKIFGSKCKLLYKGLRFDNAPSRKLVGKVVRFVYTGNLGMGRWKTLSQIASALKIINRDSLRAQLYIYSQSILTKSQKKLLDIDDTSFYMGSVSVEEIKNIQKGADVLIHVESFDWSQRYSARLSFSTKIVDYFEAHRCILAVGWEQTGAIQTLLQNKIACVITDRKQILSKLEYLVTHPEVISSFADKSLLYGKENHNQIVIRESLYRDLMNVINKKNESITS